MLSTAGTAFKTAATSCLLKNHGANGIGKRDGFISLHRGLIIIPKYRSALVHTMHTGTSTQYFLPVERSELVRKQAPTLLGLASCDAGYIQGVWCAFISVYATLVMFNDEPGVNVSFSTI